MQETKQETPAPQVAQDKERAKRYAAKYVPNSPMSIDELLELADKYQFPYDLLLISGHAESHLGTYGRGATSKNPWNVDNVTAGDYLPTVCGFLTRCLDTWDEGQIKYMELIRNCYMNENEQVTLQAFMDRDFRTVRQVAPYCSAKVGSRYMTDKNAKFKYEDLKQKYYKI